MVENPYLLDLCIEWFQLWKCSLLWNALQQELIYGLLCHSYLVDNVVSQCGESLTDEGGLGEKLLWKDVFPWKLIYVPIEFDKKVNTL